MIKCKRNIFLIFGYLLLMAILFVPYNHFINTVKTNELGLKDLDIKKKSGYLFLPLFFKAKANEIKMDWTFEGYDFNSDLFITELAIIFLAGGFAYILFCVVLKKSEKKGKMSEK